MESMDGLDPDMVYEVPDTPDRLMIRHPVDRSSKPSWERIGVGKGINQSLPHRDFWHSNKTCLRRRRDSSHHDGLSAMPKTHEDLFRQADFSGSMLEPGDTKSELDPTLVSNRSRESTKNVELGEKSLHPLSHPTQCRDLRRKVTNPDHNKESSGGSSRTSRLLRRPWSGSGIALTRKPVVAEEKASKLDDNNLEVKSRDKGKGIDQGLTNSIDLEKGSSSPLVSNQDIENGRDLCRNATSNMMRVRSLRTTGQRRLVRNGCISPLNIGHGKSMLKANHDKVENNGISSKEIIIISPDSDGRRAEKLKGKVTVDDVVVSYEQHATNKSRLSRVDSLFAKEVTASPYKEDVTDSFEDKGWRTAHVHMKKPSMFPLSNGTANISENEGASSHRSYWSHGTTKGNNSSTTAAYDLCEDTSLQHQSNVIPASDSQTRNMNGKRKFSLTRPRTGDCSSSASSDSKMSNPQSSGQAFNFRPVRGLRPQHDGSRLAPVIEVDDLQSPEVVYRSPLQNHARTSDNSEDTARQVESDEILARRLQEELYNETPRTGGMEEIDATIAWSLLQEDDGHHASSRRQDQSRHRDTSGSTVRARIHQSLTRATHRARRPMPNNRMAQLRRELNRPVTAGMSLEMRLDFLEALEIAFGDDNGTPRRSLNRRIQRDFNENDYEMLLALDENINHASASERQIDDLPLSVVQNDNPEETCAVCLDSPSVGDTIRHLPCLHKFHKECIDTWLRRKKTCPICKSCIT